MMNVIDIELGTLALAFGGFGLIALVMLAAVVVVGLKEEVALRAGKWPCELERPAAHLASGASRALV